MSLNELYWFAPGTYQGHILVYLSTWLQNKNAGTSPETQHSHLCQILLNVSSVQNLKRRFRVWRNYPEYLDFITKKEEHFWSKSCMCMVALVKNVKWKAFTKEYLLVIPLTFTWFISASKRDLMFDIHKLNNTKKIDILGRFVTSVSDEGKIVLRGTWRMTMDSVNKWQALSNLPSSGTHPNSWGIGPTAVPAEGLAPGPWFNHCPARGEAKQATKLPSGFPSSCH